MNNKKCHKISHPSYETELPSLNRIAGQVEGVKKMINERKYCPDILMQLKALRSAIKSLELRILDEHLSTCVAQACTCNDPKEQQNKIDEIRTLIKRMD